MSAKTKKSEPVSRKREIINTVIYLAVVVLLAWFIIAFIMQRTSVEGNSMYPTLSDGDQLFIEKVSYRFSDPDRFDIIVFEVPNREGVHYIKRVIGLPGETVQIKDGVIYINGSPLEENYGREVMERAGRASQPITLGEDEFFVLGDNRNDSLDSREESVGNVHKSQILGHAFVRFWPLGDFTFLKGK